ncbi:uncharacterized protein LOC128960326 [Oppia nitens]|uniref:uncharacterized protein LOC128960326 n=1 Tax=Oppia nitens TaxID=1686743 RepID=UPI0023DC2DCC|nr:uncharacterized protein LOC128960326 [Oppia nitens]
MTTIPVNCGQLCPPLQYSSVEWRLQTQVSSRSARDELKAEVIMKFKLIDSLANDKYVVMKTDITNLIRFHDVLEDALMSSRSQQLLQISRLT